MRERGLKFDAEPKMRTIDSVAPHAGAWIEILSCNANCKRNEVAPHAGAWIEMYFMLAQRSEFRRRSPCGSVD